MPSETMDIAPSDIITPEIDSTARSSLSLSLRIQLTYLDGCTA